jgi:hypothetical protein
MIANTSELIYVLTRLKTLGKVTVSIGLKQEGGGMRDFGTEIDRATKLQYCKIFPLVHDCLDTDMNEQCELTTWKLSTDLPFLLKSLKTLKIKSPYSLCNMNFWSSMLKKHDTTFLTQAISCNTFLANVEPGYHSSILERPGVQVSARRRAILRNHMVILGPSRQMEG